MNTILVSTAASLALVFAACGDDQDHAHAKGDDSKAAVTAASMLKDDANYATFWKLVEQAELQDTFGGEGKVTVFAPTEKAFAQAGDYLSVISESKELAAEFVKNHVVSGSMKIAELKAGDLPTMGTLVLDVENVSHGDMDEDHFHVHDAHINHPDQTVANGVVHGMDEYFSTK